MTRIKAVIFDMDGVLIDAKDWHYEALNRALAPFGYAISRDDHLAIFDGLPTRQKLEILSRDGGFPRSLHQTVSDLKQQYTLDIAKTRCRPQFIHEDALSRLRNEGYVLGVASNAVRSSVELMMERANLAQYLDFILSNQDVARPKPDPEIYETAIVLAGVEPGECVVVEDNHNGIESATCAGAHVLPVSCVSEVRYSRIRSFIEAVEKSIARDRFPAMIKAA
jgi:HAD superfamily hydrolase (TIGR01509 family)